MRHLFLTEDRRLTEEKGSRLTFFLPSSVDVPRKPTVKDTPGAAADPEVGRICDSSLVLDQGRYSGSSPIPGRLILGHAVVGDDPQLGAVASARAVGEPELFQVGKHLGDGVLGNPGGFGLADVLSEQVDQDEAAELGGGGLELDGYPVEHALWQLVVLPPAPCEAVTFLLVLDERPARVRDMERPLLPAQHAPVDRDPRPVHGRCHWPERVDDDFDHRVGNDLEKVQLYPG